MVTPEVISDLTPRIINLVISSLQKKKKKKTIKKTELHKALNLMIQQGNIPPLTHQIYHFGPYISEIDTILSKLEMEGFLKRINGEFRLTEKTIKNREQILKNFEELIKQEKVGERNIGDFLIQNKWILGFEYVDLLPEKKIGLNGRTDFLLKKSNGNYDIVELKKPSMPLFLHTKTFSKLSSPLKDAISQMVSYLSKYDTLYLFQKEESGLDVFYPKGIIIIGRNIELDKKPLKAHNSFLHRIEIQTYDELLGRTKTTLQNLLKDAP